MYRNGKTVYQLAEVFGIHRTTVGIILRRHGVATRNSVPVSERAEVARLRDEDKRHGAIAKKFGARATSLTTAYVKARNGETNEVPHGCRWHTAATAYISKWAKMPRLGMDVKDVLLVRSMEPSTVVLDSDGYTLRYGKMDDPYTGERLVFEQATDTEGFHIELDHVVSLADVFVSGGHRWLPTSGNWLKVANFPANLLAVSKRVNQEKGSRNASLWLPDNPRRDFRQRFVMLQIQVKSTFRLSVTQSEKAAILAVLDEPPAIRYAG